MSQSRRYRWSSRSKPLVLIPETGDLRRSGNQLVVKALQLGRRNITCQPQGTRRALPRSERVAHCVHPAVFAEVMASAGSIPLAVARGTPWGRAMNPQGRSSVPCASTVMESRSSLRHWSRTITRLRGPAEHGQPRAFESPRPRHKHGPQRVRCRPRCLQSPPGRAKVPATAWGI